MTDLRAAAAWLDTALPSVRVAANAPTVGSRGDQPDHLGDLATAARRVAELLDEIHALPIDAFRSALPDAIVGWDAVAARILGRPLIDTSQLPAPYDRYDHETLRRLWIEGRPETEELVVCHGQPRLEMMGFAEARVVSIGVGSDRPPLVADRHLDLAVAYRSIIEEFGAEAVFPFHDGLQSAVDLVRLDHYVLASHLW